METRISTALFLRLSHFFSRGHFDDRPNLRVRDKTRLVDYRKCQRLFWLVIGKTHPDAERAFDLDIVPVWHFDAKFSYAASYLIYVRTRNAGICPFVHSVNLAFPSLDEAPFVT
jgi:hypothetical protein